MRIQPDINLDGRMGGWRIFIVSFISFISFLRPDVTMLLKLELN